MSLTLDRIGTLLKENAGWLLVWSVVPLLATKTLFNAPVIVMALIGLARLVRDPRRYLDDPAYRTLLLLFACLWAPMVLSLPDAVEPRRAVSTALIWLRFPLAAVFVFDVLADATARRRLLAASALTVLVWAGDAILQVVVGHNLLGYPYQGGRATGMFHPRLALGLVPAVFIPPAVVWLATRRRRWALWMLAPLAVGGIALGGNRTGWMIMALGLTGAAWWLMRNPRRRPSPKAWLAAALVVSVGVAGAMQVEGFRHRVDKTLAALDLSRGGLDEAVGGRVSIWVTALNMARAHWINGVGPRGFRYVYEAYAGENDRFRGSGITPTHPHQTALEVAAETGLLGLAGFVLFWAVLVDRLMRAFAVSGTGSPFPWLLGAGIAAFPLNAHMALYASYWSTVLWWLLIVALAWGRVAGAVVRR